MFHPFFSTGLKARPTGKSRSDPRLSAFQPHLSWPSQWNEKLASLPLKSRCHRDDDRSQQDSWGWVGSKWAFVSGTKVWATISPCHTWIPDFFTSNTRIMNRFTFCSPLLSHVTDTTLCKLCKRTVKKRGERNLSLIRIKSLPKFSFNSIELAAYQIQWCFGDNLD